MKNILIISGSLDKPSHTRSLCEEVKFKLQKKNSFTVNLLDLSNRNIPYADTKYHKNPSKHPDPFVSKMVSLAKEADAIILGSPLYHNSYSGILKNALDCLSIQEFYMKPVGLLSNGGGIRNVQALDHLRIVVRGLSGIAIPQQIATCKSDFSRSENGYILINEQIKQRINLFYKQLKIMTDQKQLSFPGV